MQVLVYIYIYRSVNVHIVTFTVTHMHDTILMVDYSSHMLLTHRELEKIVELKGVSF